MKRIAVLLSSLMVALGAVAQTPARVGELRTLLQKPAVKAPAAQPQAPPTPQPVSTATKPRQMSAEERAEMRRQLTEFHRPPGKGS
jgi:hypothetical protein